MNDLLDFQKYWISIGNLQKDDWIIRMWLHNSIDFRSFKLLYDIIENINCDFDPTQKHPLLKTRRDCLDTLQKLDLDGLTEEDATNITLTITLFSEQIALFLIDFSL